MTREEYAAVIDQYHREIRAHLLCRYDIGAKRYGGDVDLESRDWKKEEQDEHLDGLAYRLFNREKERRRAEAERGGGLR